MEGVSDDNDDDDDDEGMDSADEALCEMFGISKFPSRDDEVEKRSNSLDSKIQAPPPLPSVSSSSKEQTALPNHSIDEVLSIIQSHSLPQTYMDESICKFPPELSIPPTTMRKITDELIWGSHRYPSDRTYETIQFFRKPPPPPDNSTTASTVSDGCYSAVGERRELTRMENFINTHPTWSHLCHNHFANCVSALTGERMVLYKEKLNLKPPGGSGFAPHLDTPSLRVALGRQGPQTFVTLMVAIDDMNEGNGCLRLVHGAWSESNRCEIIVPVDSASDHDEHDGKGSQRRRNGGKNPDAGGREGAIPAHVSEGQTYTNLLCKGGSMAMFHGWTPHRSSANISRFPRRAVFLTYNPLREGEFHDLYYVRMTQLRDDWKRKTMNSVEREKKREQNEISCELAALSSIPHI